MRARTMYRTEPVRPVTMACRMDLGAIQLVWFANEWDTVKGGAPSGTSSSSYPCGAAPSASTGAPLRFELPPSAQRSGGWMRKSE